jgi:UPF0755 protein
MLKIIQKLLHKPAETPQTSAAPLSPLPINGQPSGLTPKKRTKRTVLIIVAAIAGLIILLGFGALIWYKTQTAPLSSDTTKLIPVTIVSGSTSNTIGQLLQNKAIIRSATAFDIYTRISGTKDKLQAGSYRLAPSESIAAIVKHLVNGTIDTFSITFYPGATLVDNSNTTASAKKDVTTVLKQAGYTDDQIKAGLDATYSSPLFDSKPASADLEGYVYGQTYQFNAGATVSDILQRTFQEFYTALTNNNIIAGIKAQGYTLYQGITLASIVQREVASPASSASGPTSDQKQVAQVFYTRLASGMMLGSDVTYQYAANKLGIAPDVSLDSPYNTRLYAGLPPGPISAPGLTALEAVAAPAAGNYLFFLSGDDGKTYFATTAAEHQANITNYCQQKCSVQ